jgi:NADH-quinone oxidoreductase subunit M
VSACPGSSHVVTLLTFLPLLGGLVTLGIGRKSGKTARGLAFAFSLLSLGLALAIWGCFDSAFGGFQFQEVHSWMPALGIQYRVAVDGLSLTLALLTAVVVPMAILASGNRFAAAGARAGADRLAGESAGERPELYYALVLFLQSGLFGTFTALNFFHWFIFWELSLVPAFFLIRLWGGPGRASAATRFFVYTLFGSVALLLAFLAIFVATDRVSDFTALAEWARSGRLVPALATKLAWHGLAARKVALLVFLCAFLGFAVKVPLMPFHTWLPSAYAEAPTGTTMLLTGLMSKMGVYGFLRILLPIFPEQMQWLRVPLLVLAVLTIVCSAGAAVAQTDLKRLLAYSSVNHLGYCLLGVFAVATPAAGVVAAGSQKAAALDGVILQLFNHGLTAATLFWFVGLIEKRSGGLRGLNDFGGLRSVAPVLCGLMGIALFSSMGLPGLNGFVGEFLIFKGAFALAPCSTALAAIGLLLTAIFLLTLLQRVFNGPLNERWSAMPDLTTGERVMLATPVALMLVLGVYPQLALGVIDGSVTRLLGALPF